ncbi:MAG: hypothetical protein WAX69_14930, partial [Victivallales bacterium]
MNAAMRMMKWAQLCISSGIMLGLGYIATGQETQEGYRITRGYYQYQIPPEEEGRGSGNEPIPMDMAKGRLSDGRGKDGGQGVGFPGGAKSPGFVSIVFDLLEDQPLNQVDIIAPPPNEYWGIRDVTVFYRSSSDRAYRVAGTRVWSKDIPQMSFALNNQPARFVKITLSRGANPYVHRPLQEVIILSAKKPVESKLPAPDATKMLPEFHTDAVLVDRYGQYLYEDWPGKIKEDAQLVEDAKKEEAELADVALDLKRFDQYGGVKAGPSAAASGFFRLENLNNRWWFITPEGNR